MLGHDLAGGIGDRALPGEPERLALADLVHIDVRAPIFECSGLNAKPVIGGKRRHVGRNADQQISAVGGQRAGNFRKLDIEANHQAARHAGQRDHGQRVTGRIDARFRAKQLGLAITAGQRAVTVDGQCAIRDRRLTLFSKANHHRRVVATCQTGQAPYVGALDRARRRGRLSRCIAPQKQLGPDHDIGVRVGRQAMLDRRRVGCDIAQTGPALNQRDASAVFVAVRHAVVSNESLGGACVNPRVIQASHATPRPSQILPTTTASTSSLHSR